MYHYIDDKEFLKQMRVLCSDIVNQLVQSINKNSVMTVEAHLVGSGGRNLITQNEKEPIDLDYNLCVLKVSGISLDDGKAIKEHIRKHFNIVLKHNGWSDCQDSTSALSTQTRHFKTGNQTHFKIDLAIVCKRNNVWERLIHQKTGLVSFDQWYWNKVPNFRRSGDSKSLADKVNAIKKKNLWLEVRDLYLKKKNMYLKDGDRNHPSFIVYIETINEIYYKSFR